MIDVLLTAFFAAFFWFHFGWHLAHLVQHVFEDDHTRIWWVLGAFALAITSTLCSISTLIK